MKANGRSPGEAPLKQTDQARIKEQLAAAMKEHPDWAREQLIKEIPEKGRKELWLREMAEPPRCY